MKLLQSLLVLLVLMTTSLNAQILEPVKWDFSTEKISDNEHNLIFTASIDKGWTVYSQFTSDDGPVPTELIFENVESAELIGKASEKGHKKEGLDKLFDVNVIKFLADENFVMTQKVKVSDDSKPISGYLTFMTCNDKTCLPPSDVDFSFEVKNSAGGASSAPKTETKKEVVKIESKSEGSNIKVTAKTNTSGITVSNGSTDEIKISTKADDVDKITIESNISNESDVQAPPAQGMLEPVKWITEKKKLSDDEYELKYTAKIDKGWAVYSIYMEEGGPVPTSITYENAEGAEMIGKAVETGNKKEGFDKMWKDEVDNVIKFKSGQDYTISQKVKITDPSKPFTGYLTYMTCNDKTCLPPSDIDFNWGFGELASGSGSSSLADATGLSGISGMKINADGKVDQRIGSIVETYEAPLSDCGKTEGKNESSLLWLLVAGMLGGFAALLTPCVFPMIPITVSFFTKDTKRKGWMNGLIYGISIIVIYVVLGLIITVTLGPEALQALSTNWIANTAFFLLYWTDCWFCSCSGCQRWIYWTISSYVWIFVRIGIAIWIVCGIPSMVEFSTTIRWMDE